MRKLVVAVFSVLALAAASAAPASASSKSTLSLSAKITSFRATAAGVQGVGLLSGKLHSGSSVSHSSAKVKFSVVGGASGGRCNVLYLRLAPLDLELLGAEVKTSYITLKVYAVKGEVLGNLFCGLAQANVTFPKSAAVAHALNARLHGHSLRVFSASETFHARTAATTPAPASCQVLKLVLGPLHLNLLGLVVDLYGYSPAYPVKVFINAIPSEGLLGQLLCSLAGGTGITSIAGLQSLLSTLGLSLSTTQIQNLLNQLGITSLTSGLTQLQLNQILAALGLGSQTPSG